MEPIEESKRPSQDENTGREENEARGRQKLGQGLAKLVHICPANEFWGNEPKGKELDYDPTSVEPDTHIVVVC